MGKDIFQRIAELNLPLGQYVVIGGGILEVLGIRDTKDLDIVVTQELFEKLRQSKNYNEEMRWGKVFLIGDGIEIGVRLEWEHYHCTTEEAIKTATVIRGIPFLNLEETIKFKKAMGREKDFKDIVLIEDYLKNNNHARN